MQYHLNSYSILADFIRDTAFVVTVDGNIHFFEKEVETTRLGSAISCAALAKDKLSILIACEDGRIFRVMGHDTYLEIAHYSNKWISALCCGPHNSFAFASGRTVFVHYDQAILEFPQQHSVEGLCFSPKGVRLAVSHYNGVTLFWPADAKNAKAQNQTFLEWKGAHLALCFSPDGRYVITSMQENALHGWCLDHKQHLRMTGYPAKVKNFSWSAKGRFLATSGAQSAILWPFTGKNGPMGKAPLELGPYSEKLVTYVACHPDKDIIAIGYNDGSLYLCQFQDQKEMLLRQGQGSAITSSNWNLSGQQLVFGTANGEVGLIPIILPIL